MSLRVGVVLCVLNEADHIRSAIRSAFAAGADRVLVSDGGSTDATRRISRETGAEVIEASDVRGVQANAGAAAAGDCDILCFLHGDSALPSGAGAAMRRAIASGAPSGGFLLRFAESRFRLRVTAALINTRTRLTRAPWGDQAQFYERSAFWRLGGFLPIPIMEDYDLAVRARRMGVPAIIPLRVTTSGRRFIQRGLLKTTWLNWRTIARYHAGVSPQRLAEEYRRQRD